MRELAEIFLDDNVALLEDLKCAIAVSDPLRTERFAHSLKGIAANIGGIRVEAAALAVEEAARSGSLELAQLAVAPLAVELDRLRDALRRLVLGQRTIAST